MYYTEIIRFRIKKRSIELGSLFFSRLLYSYSSEGGKAWQQGLFISIQMIFVVPALILDSICLFVYAIYRLLMFLFKFFFNSLFEIFKSGSQSFLTPLFKWAFLIIAIMFSYTIISNGTWRKYIETFSQLLSQLW